MTTQCPVPQALCELSPGTTLDLEFTFLDPDGQPLDISGKTLWFTLEIDPEQAALDANDLQASTTFPSDANSLLGLGAMRVLPLETAVLLPGQVYYFRFDLEDGVEERHLMGTGTVVTGQASKIP